MNFACSMFAGFVVAGVIAGGLCATLEWGATGLGVYCGIVTTISVATMCIVSHVEAKKQNGS